MGSVVNLGEVLKIKVRVNLGGRNIRVTQELLNTPQIVAGFQQMRGERVTEHMWMQVLPETLPFGPGSEQLLNSTRS